MSGLELKIKELADKLYIDAEHFAEDAHNIHSDWFEQAWFLIRRAFQSVANEAHEESRERIEELEEASDLLISVAIPTVKGYDEMLTQTTQQAERIERLEKAILGVSSEERGDFDYCPWCHKRFGYGVEKHHNHCLRAQIQNQRTTQ